MKRKKRTNATELSVFIIKTDEEYNIVDPSMDGDGIPVKLFGYIIENLSKAIEKYKSEISHSDRPKIICDEPI